MPRYQMDLDDVFADVDPPYMDEDGIVIWPDAGDVEIDEDEDDDEDADDE